jgi:LysM repeat protein
MSPPGPQPVLDSLAQMDDKNSVREDTAELLGHTSEQGYDYTVRAGDTLTAIASACRALGIPITVNELRQANPGPHPDRLRIGQRIFIPAPKAVPPKPPE